MRDELRGQVPDFKFHIWLEPLELAAMRGSTLYVRAPEHIRTSVAERYLPLLRDAARRAGREHVTVHVVGPEWCPDDADCEEPGGGAEDAGLNPKYTFEQFVIGEGNRFAHAAALAAAELPAQAYNPLFLHGPPGLGKTHLLHAIGSYVQRFGGLRVRYATIEEFTTEFVGAVRTRRTETFKEDFRGADVVLIDDVQFLAGAHAHTRGVLPHVQRPATTPAGRWCSPPTGPPRSSRTWRTASRSASAPVSWWSSSRPAPTCARPSSPSERVSTACDMRPRRAHGDRRRGDQQHQGPRGRARSAWWPTPPSAARSRRRRWPAMSSRRLGGRRAGRPASSPRSSTPPPREFGVERTALLARDRRPPVAKARHVAMYLARELTDHSLPEIGRRLGGRNHATVIHAINRVTAAMQTDPADAHGRRQPQRTQLGRHPVTAATTATIHTLNRFRQQARSPTPRANTRPS